MQYLTQWKFKTLKFFLQNFLKKIKNFQKPLDKQEVLCYNYYRKEKRGK